MKNMIIAQSGGPSSAINASLAGAVQRAMASDEIGTVYGALNGLEGMLKRQIVSLSDQLRTSEDLELLAHTPAMALGTCRFKLSKTVDDTYHQVLAILREYNIGYFFYIGGNDSMDTINNLSAFFRSQGEEIKCVGIPKTIDNDLNLTDHTPGFASAARFVATTAIEVLIDASSYPGRSVTVLEVMGRNAGWLTAAAVMARTSGFTGPHLIYLPEAPFDPEDFLKQIEAKFQQENHLLVAVSEGVKLKDGKYLSESDRGAKDMFGHASLGGVAQVLTEMVRKKFDCRTRGVELSVMQRVGAHLASGVDIAEGREVGLRAVEAALAGETDVMVCIKRVSNTPYLARFETNLLKDIANVERIVPQEWICDGGTNVTSDVVEYMRPLLRGNNELQYTDGMPRFFKLDRTKIVKP